MATALLTGGTGYIASHTCIELIRAGFDCVLFDNLCNSSSIVVDRIESITGTRPYFIQGDVRDRSALAQLFSSHRVDTVLHFAGLKAVGESVAKPLMYYENNVVGSTILLDAMQAHGVRCIVFSSSATVYDPSPGMPLNETSPTGPTNPYGQTKLMVERILTDVSQADTRWRVICLRYFNPVGAHESGLIGEDPRGTPNNLLPFVAQVAVGRLPVLRIFGNDYPTEDGTGVRDYIHVTDLAMGHVAAVRRLLGNSPIEHSVVNLGTGRGHSVLEVLSTFMRVSGKHIPYELVDRRAGDAAISFADVSLAKEYLDWHACLGLEQMCADAWRWQSANPHGLSGV